MKFKNSVEATEFMDKLNDMVYDPRFINWVVSTDENFGTDAYDKYRKMKLLFLSMMAEIDKAI